MDEMPAYETPASEALAQLPVTNLVHIDVNRLEDILRLYEEDRYGFFGKIPRIR